VTKKKLEGKLETFTKIFAIFLGHVTGPQSEKKIFIFSARNFLYVKITKLKKIWKLFKVEISSFKILFFLNLNFVHL